MYHVLEDKAENVSIVSPEDQMTSIEHMTAELATRGGHSHRCRVQSCDRGQDF